MSGTPMRTAAVIVVLLFYALHQDFWLWREARPLLFGFLPVGIWYHVLYSVASSLLLWTLMHFFWPSHLETAGEARE